jgi:thioredoxin-dependent peroxiredoxin
MSRPAPGDKAPAIQAPDQNGKTHKLADYKGTNVVLYFYPKDDTPGCTTQSCSFRDALGELKAANAQVIGVSPDSVESHEAFAAKYNLPFPLLADPERKIIQDYGVAKGEKSAQRVTFLIGGDGKILKVYPKVDVKNHSQEILADLQKLQVA